MDSTDLRWDNIRKAMDRQEWERDPDNGNDVRSLYLGSILSLTPSGKVYTPWANSNIRPCDTCNAIGCDGPCDADSPCTDSTGPPLSGEGHCEVCRDQAWQKAFEREASEHGFWIGAPFESGDGCDIFISESRDSEDE